MNPSNPLRQRRPARVSSGGRVAGEFDGPSRGSRVGLDQRSPPLAEMLEGLEGRAVVVQTAPAQKRAQGVRVFYGQARALSLMRKGRVGGIAEEHHPAAAPPGQARQVDESPETHVPLDVADEIEDARIPAVFGEDSQSLIAGGRQVIR